MSHGAVELLSTFLARVPLRPHRLTRFSLIPHRMSCLPRQARYMRKALLPAARASACKIVSSFVDGSFVADVTLRINWRSTAYHYGLGAFLHSVGLLRAAVGRDRLAFRFVAAPLFPVVALTGRGAVAGLASRALLDAAVQRSRAGGTGGDKIHLTLELEIYEFEDRPRKERWRVR